MAVQAQEVPRITAEALKALMDTRQAVEIIDVRLPDAYFSSPVTILGALRIPPDQISQWYQSIPRAPLIVTFCTERHEAVSVRVAHYLLSHGFPHVEVLQGGFYAWEALGYPTAPR